MWKTKYLNIKKRVKVDCVQVFSLNYERFHKNDILFLFFQYKFAIRKFAFYSFIFGQGLYYMKRKYCANKMCILQDCLKEMNIKISRTEIYRLIQLYLNLGQYKKMYYCCNVSFLKKYSNQLSLYLILHPEEAEFWK